jgi:uncharacterized repeat protein (TIGR01451 family)
MVNSSKHGCSRRCTMNKRYLSAITAICASGIALALLGVFLTSRAGTSYASPQEEIAAAPDLVIDAQAAEEAILADSVITFTLLYTNTLPDQTLSDVVIVATLWRSQYYSGSYCSDPIIPTTSFTYSGGFSEEYVLEWGLGSLAPATGGWIVVTTTVPPEAEPRYGYEAWDTLGMSALITTTNPGISSGNPDGEEADTVGVTVVGPVLYFYENGKTATPSKVLPGHLLTYTLTLRNDDREDAISATGIVITDTLPDHTTIYAVGSGGVYSPSTGMLVWNPPGSLSPGGSVFVSYTVRVTESMWTCNTTDMKIWNQKADDIATANETIRPVTGRKDLSTSIRDVTEKAVETPDPPSGAQEVFPGGIITYTVTIHNPYHNQLLDGLDLTDTFQAEGFTFLEMLPGGPTPVITSPQVVWEDLSVQAGGTISFAFRTWVPYHIDIGSRSRTYENNLSSSAPGIVICEMKTKNPSRVTVLRQIELKKEVSPDQVLSGEIVTYTITAKNHGDTTISSLRITDTLPPNKPEHEGADFHFLDMLFGPEPVAEFQDNPVAWDNLSVTANSEISLSFRAVAIGWPLRSYGNAVSAASPWTTVPAITDKAKVTIDSPLRMDKTVNPSETFVETSVDYSVEVCNVATGTYTLSEFEDRLPAGFFEKATGLTTYVYDISPDRDLAPGECWEHTFGVDVTLDAGCDETFVQTGKKDCTNSTVWIHAISPEPLWYCNATNLAPLEVKPHVSIEKEADHTAVITGETFVYTITLTNQSSQDVHDITIRDTLAGASGLYFVYSDTVPGYPAPDVINPPSLEWQNYTIQAGDQLVLAFRVRVPEGMATGEYKNTVTASTTDLACIQDIDPTAKVKVMENVIEFTKDASPDEVPPRGIVQYEIKLVNKDSVPISGVVITETLPTFPVPGYDFKFVDMVAGDPEPDEINGRELIWRNLTIPGTGDKTLRLRFQAQATILLREYDNEVTAWCPRIGVIEPKDPPGIEAPVTVLPGVVLYKTVFPTQTANGGTVVYTITLYNASEVDLQEVRITDTLPSDFRYVRTLPGSPGPFFRQQRTVAWNLGEVKKGNDTQIVFQAWAQAPPGSALITTTYHNKIKGFSPSALIPGVEEAAPLILTPRDLPKVYLPLVLRG